ncbi:MAG: DUF6048 family protein [Bacteroidales bacterium]|jgi:hypothetical protein|nr:DUF6048 family protein [Bacteroidales bacterium]
MRKISGFIISVLLLVPLWCQGQDTTRYPVNAMKGIRLGIDLSKLALPLIYHNERKGVEITVDRYVKGNFFAVVEAGWAGTDLHRDTAYHYRSNGFYGRLGIDYNLLKPRRPYSNDLLYAGFRYGISVFSHRADNVTVPGYYWPDAHAQSIPASTLHVHWIEFLLGVKAEVLKNFYIGATFSGRFRLVPPKDPYSTPYIVPGYGSGSVKFAVGLNYYIAYNIQFF